jgi:hypothetical protein
MSLHKTNLSTTTSITTSYAGEFAGKYIAAALLSAPTLDKGGITIMPNVKYKSSYQTCCYRWLSSKTLLVTLTLRLLSH